MLRGAKFKFVLLTQYYPPEVGGAQVLLSSLAAELQRQGHDVRVVTALPNYPTGRIFEGFRGRLFAREEREGVPIFRSWVYAAQSARFFPRLANYLSFCFSSLLAFFWIAKPDLIFVDSPPLFLGLTALLLASAKRTRWVINVSDLWPDAVAESGLLNSPVLLRAARMLESFLYRRADFVSTVTEGIVRILREDKQVPAEKILFLPVGVDTALFQPRPADQVLLDQHQLTGRSVFIYAGTLGHAQGLPLLLDVADLLRERRDIALVFVGDGPVKSELRAQCDRRKLSAVFFVEPVPLNEMPRWWSVATGALVPLKDQTVHHSARPSKVFPALASGVPVIFSGRGEMARIISNAQAGMVIPPEQPQQMADCILSLSNDAALARQMGANGRRLCEAEFSWARVVQRWLSEIPARPLH